MEGPDFRPAAAMAAKIGFNQNLAEYRMQLLAQEFRKLVTAARDHFDQIEEAASPTRTLRRNRYQLACRVQTRYLFELLADC
jgi:hypothetical protein